MIYRELWNKCNVSTVLILPIFSDLLKNIRSTDNNAEYSIHGLFYDCGLINAYLYEEDVSYDNTLKLLFDRETLMNTQIFINKPVPTLFDLLVNSKYFKKVKVNGEFIVIYLKIDRKWDNDIKEIISSNYSKVSEKYKELLLLKGSKVLSSNKVIDYLFLKNIPAKIVYKSNKLEDVLKEIFSFSEPIDGEYFIKFNFLNETLDL
jgi:hypothetical protein